MLTFADDERVIILLRRHWWVLVGPAALTAALFLLPPIAVTTLPRLFPNWPWEILVLLSDVLFYAYLLLLLAFVFLVWTDYYLDVWIITNKRIIDIEQKGLFNRKISEFSIDRVQDVSIQVHGIIETLLKFGSIKVDTAGHSEFVIEDVPDLYRAKDAILHYSAAARSAMKD